MIVEMANKGGMWSTIIRACCSMLTSRVDEVVDDGMVNKVVSLTVPCFAEVHPVLLADTLD